MKFRRIHVTDKYYALGVDEDTNAPVMEIAMTRIAWYYRYFKISTDALNGYPGNRDAMDKLATFYAEPNAHRRHKEMFLYSEKSIENEK